MITEALLKLGSWFFQILWYPLSLIPDGTSYLDSGTEALGYFINRSHGYDFILPVNEALVMFRLSIIITVGISIYYFVVFMIRFIRGF